MCVIGICNTKRIEKPEFSESFRLNDDGVGFAWQENGKVRYIKGIMVMEEAWKAYNKHVPQDCFPHVVHFRKGTPKVKDLTHPFNITEESEIYLNYEGEDQILFHNGGINMWKPMLIQTLLRTGKKLEGEWSDTRMIAIWIKLLGENVLEILDGKFVVMSPTDVNYYGNWEKEDKGILWSNRTYVVTGVTGRNYSGVVGGTSHHTTPYQNAYQGSALTGTTPSVKRDGIRSLDFGHMDTIEDLQNGVEFLI